MKLILLSLIGASLMMTGCGPMLTDQSHQSQSQASYRFDRIKRHGGGPRPSPSPTASPMPAPVSLLQISNLRVSSVTSTTALVDWDLSDYGTGQVEYGLSASQLTLRNTAELTLNYKSHQQPLEGLSAGTTYYYRAASRNGAGISAVSTVSSFKTLALTTSPQPTPSPSPSLQPTPTPALSNNWRVTYSPPAMAQPLTIRIPADVPLTDWPSYNGHCAGKIYNIEIPAGQDAIITQSGSVPLDKPIWITGGRHVRVIGLEISMKVQPGCNQDVLKVPGGIALRLEQSGTTFVEGLKMDLNGHVTDCIVSRNFNSTEAQALANRNVYIQNSACRGGVGTHPGSPGGDYLHGDFFQNQGDPNDPINRVVFENISQQTTASGVVLDGKINEAIAINFEFALDRRFPNSLWVLNPLWMTGNRVFFKNIYTEFGSELETANMPKCVRDNSAGIYYSYENDGPIQFSPEIHKGFPAQAFAPWDKIGLSYQSPHP